MDEKRFIIRELEEKKSADTEERNNLLAGLGEILLKRIDESTPQSEKMPEIFSDSQDAGFGTVFEEYRLHQKEIADSRDTIKSLESELQKLKELEAVVLTKESEISRINQDLEEVYRILGKQLLPDPEFEDIAGSSKQQEENLLLKIEDLENKLDTLEEQKGGFLAWLGKNAQMAVSKNLLQRNRSSLQRLYQSIGEKFLSFDHEKTPEGEASITLDKARELKATLNNMEIDLSSLKWERKQITDLFGIEGYPSKRITNMERRIAHVSRELPKVYLRFGNLAAEDSGASSQKILSSFLKREDSEILVKAQLLDSRIAERELGIRKINASINIETKKTEIEKLNKAIETQNQKIAFAEEAITGFKTQIAVSEKEIEELEVFLRQNE